MSNSFFQPAPTPGSFLPEDYIARKAEFRANLITLALFAVVMAGLMGAFVVTNAQWSSIRTRKEQIATEIEAEAKRVEQIRALDAQRAVMLEKAEITAALAERVPRWALLGELLLRMPLDMRVENLNLKSRRIDPAPPAMPAASAVRNLTGDAKQPAVRRAKIEAPRFEYAITIAGVAERNNDVADFIASLRQSPILDSVELQFIRDARESDRVVRKFEVTARLRDDAPSEVLTQSLRALADKRQGLLAARDGKPVPALGAASEPMDKGE